MEADAGSLAGSNVPAGNKIEILYIYIYTYIYIMYIYIYIMCIYTLGVEIKLAFFVAFVCGIFFLWHVFFVVQAPFLGSCS